MKLLLTILLIPLQLISQELEPEVIETAYFIWPWRGDEDEEVKPIQSDGPKPQFVLDEILNLEDKLLNKVFGQSLAVKTVSNALVSYAAGINDPNKPIGVFLCVGPSGVGKTELAKALAKEILGNQEQLIRVNMSEYSTEEFGVVKLIGPPRSYKGSAEGGTLSNAILKYPYSIVLLDEIEKAHTDVRRFFLHVFDEGYFTSGLGVHVDCHNCIFIITSNIASKTILKGSENLKSHDEIVRMAEPELMSILSPELYNRCDPVIFQKLTKEALNKIIEVKLEQLATRVYQQKGIFIVIDPTLMSYLKKYGYNEDLGARPINRIIKNEVTIAVARALLLDTYEKGDTMVLSFENGTIIVKKSP